MAFALALMWGGVVGAQPAGGTIRGTVTDQHAASIPGAVVTVAHEVTGATRTAVTNTEGRYELAGLPAGAYRMRVDLMGFRSATRADVRVSEAGGGTDMNFALEIRELLETVVVTGTRSEQQIGNIPGAVSVVEGLTALSGQQTTNINEALKRVPGVAMRVHLEGSTRATASIRGAGAQSTFGARGVRILVDGVPKNNAGGSGQDFINIDLASLDRVEVVRGPSSALYGNQAGGVIHFITQEGSAVPIREYRQTVGSFGLAKGQMSYFLSAFRTDQEGYRDQSEFDTTGFNAKFRYMFDDGASLTTMIAYETLKQQIPGTLTAAEVAAIDEFRTAVTYRRPLAGNDQLELTGYYVPRPIYALFSGPIRNARYLNTTPLGSLANRATVGVDYQSTPLSNAIFSRSTGAVLQQLKEDMGPSL